MFLDDIVLNVVFDLMPETKRSYVLYKLCFGAVVLVPKMLLRDVTLVPLLASHVDINLLPMLSIVVLVRQLVQPVDVSRDADQGRGARPTAIQMTSVLLIDSPVTIVQLMPPTLVPMVMHQNVLVGVVLLGL